MKVKFIERSTLSDLEKEVNDFIKSKRNVVDIKYSAMKGSLSEYSVMIIMK